MKNLASSLLFTLLLCVPIILSAQHKNSVEGDYEALMALYNSTQGQTLPKLNSTANLPSRQNAEPPFLYLIDGDIWRIKFDRNGTEEWHNAGRPWLDRTGWVNMTPQTMGDAVGIKVNAEGRVISIDLQKITKTDERWGKNQDNGNNLAGTLPKEIGNLKKVAYFNVKQNYLTGPIQRSIGNMRSLEWLSLAGQRGDVEVGSDNVSDYRTQSNEKGYEERNYFTGEIPLTIGNLSKLRVFELRRQPITGTIPPELGNCTNLIYLALNNAWGENSLSGPIPKELGRLSKLQSIDLSNGSYTDRDREGYDYGPGLTGEVPIEFQEGLVTEEKVNLSLAGNSLTGPIPEFKNLKDIRALSLRENNFTGEFPISYFNRGYNGKMWSFNIDDNNLTGQIPDEATAPQYPEKKDSYSTISVFTIGGSNKFTGEMPEWIQKMDRIIQANFSGVGFTGRFPKTLAEGPRLRLFDIRNNNFSGTLPDVDWSGERLYEILIVGNQLKGNIPSSWESMVSNYLDEQGNYDGRLWRIRMENNELTGEIPSWIADITTLERLDLSRNRFTFKDILPHYDAIKETLRRSVRSGNSRFNEYLFDLSDQKPFGNTQRRSVPQGETVVFDLREFDYEGNKYQWLKNGAPLEGKTSPVLRITNVSANDEGTYRLDVRNNALPELGIHSSKPIQFEIGQNDGVNGSDGSSGEGNRSDDAGPGTIMFPTAPKLLGPAEDLSEASLTPVFSWTPVAGADYYTFQISRARPNGMVATVRVDGTEYTHPEILDDNARHFWTVRAIKDGQPGDWASRYMFFTKSAGLPEVAIPVFPERDAENVSVKPTFKWEPVDADRYEIRILDSWTSELIVNKTVERSSFTPSTSLSENRNYTWQVKSIKGGDEGAWGPIRVFKTGEGFRAGNKNTHDKTFPSAPKLLGPAEDLSEASLTPVFSWTPVAGADYYTFQISRARPNGMVATVRVDGTEYTHPEILDDNARHFWTVRAIKDGQPGDWASRYMFFTKSAGLPEVAIPVFPERDAENVSVKPTFKWEPVDADRYEIRILDSWTSELIVNKTVERSSFTPSTSLSENRNYTWQVKSIKGGDEGAWGPIRVFKTGDSTLMSKTLVSAPVEVEATPLKTEINQNYPNPFNPSTQIEYSLESPQYVSLKVYDMAGRQVAVLVDEQKQAGRYSVTFNANNLASGVYFYRFVTNSRQFTKKMTLIK